MSAVTHTRRPSRPAGRGMAWAADDELMARYSGHRDVGISLHRACRPHSHVPPACGLARWATAWAGRSRERHASECALTSLHETYGTFAVITRTGSQVSPM